MVYSVGMGVAESFFVIYVLFSLVFSKFYAVFYDLSSVIGNFYSFMQFLRFK